MLRFTLSIMMLVWCACLAAVRARRFLPGLKAPKISSVQMVWTTMRMATWIVMTVAARIRPAAKMHPTAPTRLIPATLRIQTEATDSDPSDASDSSATPAIPAIQVMRLIQVIAAM